MLLDIGKREVLSISLTAEEKSILDLMTLRHQIKRSPMISRLIALHADVDVNISIVAEQIVSKYAESNRDFEGFLSSAKTWLEQKKISAYYQERIIDEVRNSYEKE